MAIITISRGCFSHGKEVAEATAARLGYNVIGREALIEEASQVYDIPEKEFIKSIHAPSVLERFGRGREQYLSYIQALLLAHAKNDNMVYHGHASHLLLPDIAHVLNVRIIADIADRIAFMKQSRSKGDKEAARHIAAEDAQRSRWAYYLYKIDITDPYFYDMVIHIKNITIEDAGSLICQAAQMSSFQATPESRQAIADLALSSRVKAAIENACKSDFTVSVSANNGNLRIRAAAPSVRKTGYTTPKTEDYMNEKIKQEIKDEISSAIGDIPDIANAIYEIIPPSHM